MRAFATSEGLYKPTLVVNNSDERPKLSASLMSEASGSIFKKSSSKPPVKSVPAPENTSAL